MRERDGTPVPKHPQSSVSPRSNADRSATKNIDEASISASAPTLRVGGRNTRIAQTTSKNGSASADTSINAGGRSANALILSEKCSGSRILSIPA